MEDFDPDAFASTVLRLLGSDAERFAALARAYRAEPDRFVQRYALAEYAVGARLGAALFTSLPYRLRKAIHGGGSPGDRGVDLVQPDCGLAQVKWYADGARVGTEAVAKLNNIAHVFHDYCRVDVPRRVLALRAGARVARGAVGLGSVAVVHVSDADLDGEIAAAAGRGPPASAAPPVADAVRAALEAVQERAADALAGLYARGKKVLSFELPPGTGKTWIVRRLAAFHAGRAEAAGRPPRVLVVAPRMLLIRQAAELFADAWRVYAVVDGSEWPDALAAETVPHPDSRQRTCVVLSAQSAHKIPYGLYFEAVFYDEAHMNTGRERIEGYVSREVTYLLSATLPNPNLADFRMDLREALGLGIVCEPHLTFAVFGREPEFVDYARYLAANLQYGSVLACFQTQDDARAFAGLAEAAGAGPAASYVSGDPDDILEAFRRGEMRVLSVVTRVEMGVNVHICDTVLLADPWASVVRLRQLCGRASRHHPAKSGTYTILYGVGPDPSAEGRSLERLIDMLHKEFPDVCPGSVHELADRVEVVPGTSGACVDLDPEGLAQNRAAVDVVYTRIYDAFGRRIMEGSSASERERLRLEFTIESHRLKSAGVVSLVRLREVKEAGGWDEFPDDPAHKYKELYPRAFPWECYFDIRPADAAPSLAEQVRRAYDTAIAAGETLESYEVIARMEDGPFGDLYTLLQGYDTSLPRITEDCRELFAG